MFKPRGTTRLMAKRRDSPWMALKERGTRQLWGSKGTSFKKTEQPQTKNPGQSWVMKLNIQTFDDLEGIQEPRGWQTRKTIFSHPESRAQEGPIQKKKKKLKSCQLQSAEL